MLTTFFLTATAAITGMNILPESQPRHSLILFLKFWQISGSCLFLRSLIDPREHSNKTVGMIPSTRKRKNAGWRRPRDSAENQQKLISFLWFFSFFFLAFFPSVYFFTASLSLRGWNHTEKKSEELCCLSQKKMAFSLFSFFFFVGDKIKFHLKLFVLKHKLPASQVIGWQLSSFKG